MDTSFGSVQNRKRFDRSHAATISGGFEKDVASRPRDLTSSAPILGARGCEGSAARCYIFLETALPLQIPGQTARRVPTGGRETGARQDQGWGAHAGSSSEGRIARAAPDA